MRRRKDRVHDYPDGTIAIKYDGADLPYFVSNKRLRAVLKHVQEQQQVQTVERSKKAATRCGQRRLAGERFREVNPVAL